MDPTEFDLESMLRAYLVCALWTATDEDGVPLDGSHTVEDFAVSARGDACEACFDFFHANEADLCAYAVARSESDAGHDFWLTRNGHGAGFWDRGLGAIGERLTEASRPYGCSDVYVGEDGKLHVS